MRKNVGSNSINKIYLDFLDNIKTKYLVTRIQATRLVNQNLVNFYWWLGRQIVEKQEKYNWGESVVERLSKDLRAAFPSKSGFSPQNLWKIRKFYIEYKGLPFLSQLVREIPWSHNLSIMSKVDDIKAREYYLNITKSLSLSRDMLTLKINNQTYEHHILANKQHNFEATLPKGFAQRADAAMKDIYTFEILDMEKQIRAELGAYDENEQ